MCQSTKDQSTHNHDSWWLNPSVLRWARERRGRTIEEAANKVRKKPDDIVNWEESFTVPTVRQARVLAEFYDRPFLELLLENPPYIAEPERIPDYRGQAGTQPDAGSWDIRQFQQWAEAARLNALDLFEQLEEDVPEISSNLFASTSDDPERTAVRTREFVEFPLKQQLDIARGETRLLPNLLRSILETMGILVLKRSELSGFA